MRRDVNQDVGRSDLALQFDEKVCAPSDDAGLPAVLSEDLSAFSKDVGVKYVFHIDELTSMYILTSLGPKSS